MVSRPVAAALVGVLLNLPWIASLAADGGWTAIVGPRPAGDIGHSVLDLASFDIGNARGVLLSVALYLPVVAAVLVGRGWRFGWAVRAGLLVVVFGWLAVLDDSSSLPIRMPEPGMMLVPVAIGSRPRRRMRRRLVRARRPRRDVRMATAAQHHQRHRDRRSG